MLSFAKFPIDCQYDDGAIEQMSLSDLEWAFKQAKMLLGADEFTTWERCMWSAIERVRHNPSKVTLQKIVDDLEEQKRALGRQYSATHNMRTMIKYNDIERDIRWLVGQYELTRRSKPYFLGPRY